MDGKVPTYVSGAQVAHEELPEWQGLNANICDESTVLFPPAHHGCLHLPSTRPGP